MSVVVYVPQSDGGAPVFLAERAVGSTVEDFWYESAAHATIYQSEESAMLHVSYNYPEILSAVEVMSLDEARQYM